MDRSADLKAALAFVIRRIDEQATRRGEPLDEEQRHLLNNLPEHPEAYFNNFDPESPQFFSQRNTAYERLCALAKDAHRSDRELNPESPDWEFAFNVSKLNDHPMCWLLQWAGVKQRRPWWDRWLLIFFSLLFVVLISLVTLLVASESVAAWRWVVAAAGYVGVLLLGYFASRRIEQRQLERNIESCRSTSQFMSSLAR